MATETVSEQEMTDALEMLGAGYDSIVKDEAPHDHYSQIPNMVDDYGLSPQAYRLYGHLRRVAGESGKCWQNTRTLAQSCGMSAGSVSNAKKELLETEFIPFIRIKKVAMRTGFSYDEITLTDLWKINHDVYQKTTVHNMNGSEYERLVHNVKQRITLIKNNPQKHDEEQQKPDKINLFQLYESEIGAITPMIADAIQDFEKLVPAQWIADAIHEAAVQNKRSWKYCEAILKRWKAQGNQNPVEKAVPARPAAKPTNFDANMAHVQNWLNQTGGADV